MALANPNCNPNDLVARWEVPLSGCIYIIEFEHGTTSGKRVIYVNGKEIRRVDFQFKLVGTETFDVSSMHCIIHVDVGESFAYQYSLEVNGRPLEKFTEAQSKILQCWLFAKFSTLNRIILEKDTLDVYVNGEKVETTGEFTDDGTETHFIFNNYNAFIRTTSSGNRRSGLIHSLYIDEVEVPRSTVDDYMNWCATNRF